MTMTTLLLLLCFSFLLSSVRSTFIHQTFGSRLHLSASSQAFKSLYFPSGKLRLDALWSSTKESVNVAARNNSTLPNHGWKHHASRDSLRGLSTCNSVTKARQILERALLLNNANSLGTELPPLYNSVRIPVGGSKKGISDGDLAIQTRMINKKYNIMQLIELSGDRDADRASLALIGVMIGCTLSAIVANESLSGIPEILRFIVVWILSFAPLAFVGYGIADASKLQGLLISIQRNVFPAYRQRMLQHEAGHFLMGHLLGWPIRTYSYNAVKNAVEFFPLADSDRGSSLARQLGFDKPAAGPAAVEDNYIDRSDVPYFSRDGQGSSTLERSVFRNSQNYTEFSKLPSQNDPTNSWPYRGLDDSTLDQLTVISVAGVCAEILAFGTAEGGAADLSQLRQFFTAAADGTISERETENRIRYALGYTMSQLRNHLGALDALAAVMERGGDVEECILAMENCENRSGHDGITGDYEWRRRNKFRMDSSSWLEKILLNGAMNLDTVENRLIEGKGGGYRKQTFRLTGDSPLYVALAISIVFFLWGSSGGITLH